MALQFTSLSMSHETLGLHLSEKIKAELQNTEGEVTKLRKKHVVTMDASEKSLNKLTDDIYKVKPSLIEIDCRFS